MPFLLKLILPAPFTAADVCQAMGRAQVVVQPHNGRLGALPVLGGRGALRPLRAHRRGATTVTDRPPQASELHSYFLTGGTNLDCHYL